MRARASSLMGSPATPRVGSSQQRMTTPQTSNPMVRCLRRLTTRWTLSWSGPLAEDLPMPTIDFDVAWAWTD